MIVVEPNKRSEYRREPDGSYHFRNPTNGILYGIRVVDNQTIEAFKPDQPGNTPTRLARLGGAPAALEVPQAAPPPPVATARPTSPQMATAKKYQQLSVSDPDNTQAWTACAAAALKSATSTGAEADAYAVQTAEMLQLIIVNEKESPCSDAISDNAWQAALSRTAAAREAAGRENEARRLEEDAQRLRMQREADWQRLQTETQQAIQARQAAQEAYERGTREAAAARERYEQDSAQHRQEVAQAEAARKEYERKMEEHRKLLATGRFKNN